MTESVRIERDLIGEIAVPVHALWGAHTQRAIANFPLQGSTTIGDFPELVRALLAIKHAAASANERAGTIAHDVADAIREACDMLQADFSAEHFPVHQLHGGGGTSANMNVNEVIANLAAENAGLPRGEYTFVHPTEHVNANQSTNDTFPTACRLAIRARWRDSIAALDAARDHVNSQAIALQHEPRLARTCLQDAVPATFGDLFGAYHAFLQRSIARISTRVDALSSVPLGGVVMGRTDGVPQVYLDHVFVALQGVIGDTAIHAATNRADAAQHLDDLVDVADALDVMARGVIRIAKDLRLLSSGPDGGFGELTLQPRQAGSSAMPGKVNPVLPEHAVLIAWQACAAATTVRATLDHAELDLNVWESAAVGGVNDAMRAVVDATTALARSFEGISVRRDVIATQLDSVIPLAVEAAHKQGHRDIETLAAETAGDTEAFRRQLKRLLSRES